MVRTVFQRIFLNGQTTRVEWKIEDVLRDGSLESGVFDFHGFQWKLCFEKMNNPPGIFGPPHVVCITFTKVTTPPCKTVIIQSFIEDVDKKARHSTEYSVDLQRESSKLVWFKEIYSDLTDSNRELLANGVVNGLTFVFLLTWKYESKVIKSVSRAVQAAINAEAEASSESLAVDLRRLLDEGARSDVTLKCGDHAVPAHSNILSARSKVLSAMLSTDMAECRTGVVEISDMNPPIFDQLVQFIYSAKLSDLSVDTASELYAAGDKYAIDSLKAQCSAFLKKHLAEDNACGVVALADSHSDADLKEWATVYIMQTELMRKNDIWLKFCEDHPRLSTEILNRVYKEVMCFEQPKKCDRQRYELMRLLEKAACLSRVDNPKYNLKESHGLQCGERFDF